MSNTKTSAMPIILLSIISIAAMIGGTYFSGHLSVKPKPSIKGTLFDKSIPVKPFSLIDHHKKKFSVKNFKGKWSFLFFGYTHCPDICPSTMNALKITSIELSKHPKYFSNTQFIFVSIDPGRDTPDILAKYIRFFGSNFIAITGNTTEITAFARNFGILHKVTPHKDPSKYQVAHSGHILLINPKAEWQALLRHPPKSKNKSKHIIYDYSNIRGYIK